MTHLVLNEVMKASQQWIADFNKGNIEACVNRYLSYATMKVHPFGEYEGQAAIRQFWQSFAEKKPAELVYRNVDIKVLSDKEAILSATWSMNIASGVISKELWVKGADGNWYLAEDDFTVLAQREAPIHGDKKTALVLVDFQNDYFPGGKFELANTLNAADNAGKLLDYFRQSNRPVIHVQHIFENSAAPFFVADTSGVNIYPDLAPVGDETLVVKHEISSFLHTELEQILIENGIEKLVIVGAMAQACIQSITRGARDRGYHCEVIEDAVAAPDLEVNGEALAGEQVLKANLVGLTFDMAQLKATDQWLAENR